MDRYPYNSTLYYLGLRVHLRILGIYFTHRVSACHCCRLHWLFMMSRLQFSCRDITLFNFCFFLSCICCDPCRDLHQFPFNLSNVATSELDCVSLKSASMSQLSLTAFLPTYCCIFLLSFSFLANDKLVSFFIFLYINYSFLTENQTEKWTKKR